jgi:diadenosine tetraphosphate (Ap4A) HIT family hydrolase
MTETPGTYQISQSTADCPFCSPPTTRVIWSSPGVLAVRDAFPISPGHTLIIPRRHVASWDDLTAEEKAAIMAGVDAVRALIRNEHRPDAFNIGCNDGPEAGQTVMHFHMHVIPRYAGDVADPRSGIRWILRDKAAYWDDSGS